MTLRLVPYTPERRRELHDLYREVWGSFMPEAELAWWLERNPVRPALVTLAEEDGRLLGVATMSFFRTTAGVVPMPMHVATHPSARGRGIFGRLEAENERRAAEDGAALALTFPNAATAPIFLGRLGWRELERPRLWARPLRPLRLLARALRRPVGERGGPGEPAARSASRRGPVRVEPLDRFPDEAEALAALDADHVVRDGDYLRWRYAESPRGYRAFGAFRDTNLVGLAVLGHTRLGGISSAVVADLLGEARPLLERCADEARGGADLLLALPPRPLRRAFLAAGYLPTPRTFRFLGKPLADGAAVERRWHFSLGDLDFF